MTKRLVITAMLMTLIGCASSLQYDYSDAEAVQLKHRILGGEPVSRELVTLELSDEIKQALDERIDKEWRAKQKVRALRAFLFSEEELGILYDPGATLTASEVYAEGRGNCLAMTNLFVAAARHVGIDSHYQTVSVRPTWDHEGATMIRYEHIVAVGEVDNESYVVDFLPEFILGDRPSETIDDLEALALFYNNLGAEAVVNQQPESAIAHLRKSLALNPRNADTWNNMGAALRRNEQDQLAEFAYFQALEIDAYNYSALSNLAQFYETEGRGDEAQEIMNRVDRYRRRNPYFHYFVARVFFDEGQLAEARIFLDNAVRLKRDEPQFYEALARVATAEGDSVASGRYLARAERYREEKSFSPPERVMNSRLMVRKNM